MSVDALRDVCKSGPLAGVYARLRRAKRRLRREPVAGPLLHPDTPLGADELRRLVGLLPDHARLLYSLGLQYLEYGGPDGLPKALACLRSAETLGFESPDRIALHRAVIAARTGQREEARRLALPLIPHELTVEENALREEVTRSGAEPPAADAAPTDQGEPSVRSVLAVGDDAALTAGRFPEARYLLAGPDVTGLTLPAVAGLGIAFDVALGPPGMHEPAQRAGVTFSRWRDL